METGLEGVLFFPFNQEAIPMELSAYVNEPFSLSPFPVDAASVHKEKDP